MTSELPPELVALVFFESKSEQGFEDGGLPLEASDLLVMAAISAKMTIFD